MVQQMSAPSVILLKSAAYLKHMQRHNLRNRTSESCLGRFLNSFRPFKQVERRAGCIRIQMTSFKSMFLPHVLLELIGAAIPISLVITTAWDLTVMTNTVVDVNDVTIEVGCPSEGFSAVSMNATHPVEWRTSSCGAHGTTVQGIYDGIICVIAS